MHRDFEAGKQQSNYDVNLVQTQPAAWARMATLKSKSATHMILPITPIHDTVRTYIERVVSAVVLHHLWPLRPPFWYEFGSSMKVFFHYIQSSALDASWCHIALTSANGVPGRNDVRVWRNISACDCNTGRLSLSCTRSEENRIKAKRFINTSTEIWQIIQCLYVQKLRAAHGFQAQLLLNLRVQRHFVEKKHKCRSC
jgi:hypothetical protein